MFEFFRGWRRKAGCVTLVLACVFTAGWVRSPFATDYIFVPTGTRTVIVLFSQDRHTGFAIGPFGGNESQEVLTVPLWGSQEFEDVDKLVDGKDVTCVMRWRYFGIFHSGQQDATLCIAPYWSIVIPLTLLSAWLLLSKPRQRNQTAEPLPETAV